MKPLVMLIGAILIIFLLPATIVSITEFRSTAYVEPHIVATAPGVTDADVALSQDLFNDATANVTIASDNADDAPIPSTYVAATRVLNITGLNANDSRTLQVTYKISALSDYWGADIATRTWPMMIIVGVFGLIGGAVYTGTRGGGSE